MKSNHPIRIYFSLCLLVLSSSIYLHAQSAPNAVGTFHTIEKDFNGSNIDGYNLYLPPAYQASSEDWPLIIFLQGGLGVGGKVEKIFNWGLPKMLKETTRLNSELDHLRSNSFVYIMPHISNGDFYDHPEVLTQVIEQVKEKYRINERKIYLTGLSRGGHGTWGLASKIPTTFAAIAPICARLNGIESYQGLTYLPIWVAHNPDDNVVPYSNSQKAVNTIEKKIGQEFHKSKTVASANYESHYRIFTSSENKIKPHDAWTEMYNEINFYKWLLRFEKPPKK